MLFVELHPGIRSSVIGFGCASVGGARSRTESERAIAVALEMGINHFDLARSYGYGTAEVIVGNALRGRRDEVVLATKCGIEAGAAARLLRPMKPLLRLARSVRRTLQQPAAGRKQDVANEGRVPDLLLRRVRPTPARIVRSIEQSLRALRTDRVEYLFLHEPTDELSQVDELMATFHRLRAAGKVRAFGLAAPYHDLARQGSHLARFDLLQFDCSPDVEHYRTAREQRAGQSNVIFSPLRSDKSPARTATATLRRLFADFPGSVVLCSMFQERHIRENAAAAGTDPDALAASLSHNGGPVRAARLATP